MIDAFISSLKESPEGHLFNPWFDRDEEHDRTPDAPMIRRRQLKCYLEERVNTARYLFIAEAVGYQGGHFSGIAMTSERILLGHQQKTYGISPEQVFRGLEPERTSRPELFPKGLSEPTSTLMWGALDDLEVDPYQVVLWNAVPWHPWNPKKGLLSNRTPRKAEIEAGLTRLRGFLDLFPDARPIAVGRKCEGALTQLGVEHQCVRHPANGGAPAFRRQVADLMSVEV